VTSIKRANILVDNKGCIKLADFGASKKVVKLATISEAKSMKGTPYWTAPEVICQTGHNWQADMWSVGCTVIEMATGKPPWIQQFQEVAALFHIGTTKSHPPIPEHLSHQGKDFLLKCLQREPTLRPSATALLKHPFVLPCEIHRGLDGSEDIQQQQAADNHLQQQQANRGNTELRSVKGTWRQIGQDSWKPTGVLGKGSSFSFRGSHILGEEF
jgi:serine/threonine protein kinase